jgi:predicted nucleic acid-binding protein
MPAGPVVLNNTPLVALTVLGRLDLLRDLFGEVLVPESVQDEFLAVDTALRREALASASLDTSCSPGQSTTSPPLLGT